MNDKIKPVNNYYYDREGYIKFEGTKKKQFGIKLNLAPNDSHKIKIRKNTMRYDNKLSRNQLPYHEYHT